MCKNRKYSCSTWEHASAALSVLVSFSIFSSLFYFLDRSLNFADEGMHLYSITHPDWPVTLVSDFGNFLHPLFESLGRDVYLFRLCAFLALLFISMLCILSFFLLICRHVKLPYASWCALFFALWSAVAGYYICWFPTPSYNTLALVGVYGILTALNLYAFLCRPSKSLCFLMHPHVRTFLLYAMLLLLALFGVLAFIGKPTTGAGMGILGAVYIYYTRGVRPLRARIYDILFAGVLAVCLLCLYIFAFSEGFTLIEKSLLHAELLDDSYGMFETLVFYLNFFFPTSFVMVFVTWPLWAMVLWALHRENYSLLASFVCGIMFIWFITAYIWIANYTIALMLLPLIVVVGVAAWKYRTSGEMFNFGMRLAFIFFASIFIYHAGTNTPFEYKMSEALVLPAMMIVSLCMTIRPSLRAVLMPGIALILCCATVATLLYPFFRPTRHEGVALWDMTEAVELVESTHPLKVHYGRKQFIDWIKTTALAYDLKPHTPLINTSYDGIISLFLLDGRKVEATWRVRAQYTTNEEYTRIFSYASTEDMRNAWIIKPAVDTPRNMPAKMLRHVGLPFPEGYELVGTSPIESANALWPAGQYEIWKPYQTVEKR